VQSASLLVWHFDYKLHGFVVLFLLIHHTEESTRSIINTVLNNFKLASRDYFTVNCSKEILNIISVIIVSQSAPTK